MYLEISIGKPTKRLPMESEEKAHPEMENHEVIFHLPKAFSELVREAGLEPARP